MLTEPVIAHGGTLEKSEDEIRWKLLKPETVIREKLVKPEAVIR